MFRGLSPLQFVSVALAGWRSRHLQDISDYLLEENRVFREQVGKRKLRFIDSQRKRGAERLGQAGSHCSGSAR